MYPIECFSAENPDKIEAARYYIDLNKNFLKEISVEDYEKFSEYMKGAGKDVLAQLCVAQTDKEMYKALQTIEKQLPYAKTIAVVPTLDGKVSLIHKEMARLVAKDDKEVAVDRKSLLKKQRELAVRYDELLDTCNEYRDCVHSLQYLKAKISDKDAMNFLYAKKGSELGLNDFAESLRKAMEETNQKAKEARKTAFSALREYSVEEQVNLIELERVGAISER